jgi:hypothetical protein
MQAIPLLGNFTIHCWVGDFTKGPSRLRCVCGMVQRLALVYFPFKFQIFIHSLHHINL